MNPSAEFDVVLYGATGYTGRLIAEYMTLRYGAGSGVSWAMAGRNLEKLAQVRDEIGAPAGTPLLKVDADDPASLTALARRTKVVLTTVGPYQLYGSGLVAACAAEGADYVDLTGEPLWMHKMILAHEAQAKASGARIVFSCGFDSIPFELGVQFLEMEAKRTLGHTVPRVKGRVRGMQGGFSGGTAASMRAMMGAIQADPTLMPLLMDPFSLTPGFKGPDQPSGQVTEHDPDVGADVAPFVMAAINTRNVHRSNLLQGHPWGTDFVYDEMTIVKDQPQGQAGAEDLNNLGAGMAGGGPQPGEGPTKEQREAGFYDVLFIGVGEGDERVRVSVSGTEDPGYASTSKMIAECAVCLTREAAATPGGIWTPGAAMGEHLIRRLQDNAGIQFKVE